ncbi:small multi-drug export protein [Candidatus Peregrinibacteria bacterium]|nr:small multi-drug export protein [Candidatus Peregrinibacteria bacterium]
MPSLPFFAELITFASAMLPVTELRGSIPLAMEVFKMPAWKAFALATAGNIVIVFFLLRFLEPISNFLRKHSKFFEKFFKKLFEKTRAKHSEKFNRYGAIFLVTFVGIPLPGTGGWTGALIAFIFGIPYWRAAYLVSLGVIIAGVLITLGFGSVMKIIEMIA